jgi:N-methylhydantoinase A
MGGTSTDVAAVEGGAAAITVGAVVAGVPLRLPMAEIHTVSAGGGSIAWVDDGGHLRVGPRSAGAVPGPAAYGRGGELPTVTDAHVALGRLADGAVLGGAVRLRQDLAVRALREFGTPLGLGPEEAAEAVLRVADAEMARALRVVSVERGRDPRGAALVAFGGAGPLHACGLADELGIARVLVPAAGGVLSALGLALADERRDRVRGLRIALDEAGLEELSAALDGLAEAVREDLPDAVVGLAVDCRYVGQGHELTVPVDGAAAAVGGFHRLHRARHGWSREDAPVQATAVRATAIRAVPRPPLPRSTAPGEVRGPVAVPLEGATAWVPAGWAGRVDDVGALVLEPEAGR